MAEFLIAYRKGKHNEGGWSNHPNDRGGKTWRGIAYNMHPKWAGWKIIDKIIKPGWTTKQINAALSENKELHDLELAFYKTNFWDVIWGDKIKFQRIANELYDHAINAGHTQGIRLMELTFGLPATGKMSTNLLKFINNE